MNPTMTAEMIARKSFRVTLEDGRSFTTSAKTEAEAIKVIRKHLAAIEAPARAINAGELAQTIFATTANWSTEYTNFIAAIHAMAHEVGNEMIDSIAHQLKSTHRVSIAQAGALGRFAFANNITL